MSLAVEATRSIYGAWRLARADPGGMSFFDRSALGAARSFYAAILLLPFFIVLEATRFSEELAALPLGPWLLVEILSYIISWTAFPVVMIQLSRLIGREHRYFDFLVAYNWSSIIQVGIYFPVAVLGGLEVLPESVTSVLILLVTIAVLVYQWFVTRTSLEIEGGLAAGLVLADLILAILITRYADAMIGAA